MISHADTIGVFQIESRAQHVDVATLDDLNVFMTW